MKLLKLSAKHLGFKTINFNSGLNIIAGLQKSEEHKKTYNGVGKSFALELIHLMFSAKQLDSKKKYHFLKDYGPFYLKFEHNNIEYIIEKDFSCSYFMVNNEKIIQSKYPDKLREIFLPPSFDTGVSFKQLLNIFARRYGKNYYSDILTQQGQSLHDFYQRYVNLVLLGVDITLVNQKKEIKKQLGNLEKAKKVIKDHESVFEKTNIKDLKDKLTQLIQDKENFIIAKNYDEFKQQADNLTNDLNDLRNKIYKIEEKLRLKNKALEKTKFIHIDIDEIKDIYNEAIFYFSDKVSIHLEQANEFHLKLMRNRITRLKKEITALDLTRKEIKLILGDKEQVRDTILKDLNSKGALKEYDSIVNRIQAITKEIDDLEKYKTILHDFTREKVQLNLQNSIIQQESIEYLDEIKLDQDSIENKFRDLVKQFYKNEGGSLSIKETKNRQYLFDIDVHIPSDGSQGINEVKIFCYDFLLYQLNPNLLNFIAHDGCIFSEMDPRQKTMILKVALKYIHENNLQYFINMGEATLKEIIDENNSVLTKEERAEIKESIVLELYDDKPSQRLFGIEFG